jgi:hypothetical protein
VAFPAFRRTRESGRRQLEADLHLVVLAADQGGFELDVADDSTAFHDQVIAKSVGLRAQNLDIGDPMNPAQAQRLSDEPVFDDPFPEHRVSGVIDLGLRILRLERRLGRGTLFRVVRLELCHIAHWVWHSTLYVIKDIITYKRAAGRQPSAT